MSLFVDLIRNVLTVQKCQLSHCLCPFAFAKLPCKDLRTPCRALHKFLVSTHGNHSSTHCEVKWSHDGSKFRSTLNFFMLRFNSLTQNLLYICARFFWYHLKQSLKATRWRFCFMKGGNNFFSNKFGIWASGDLHYNEQTVWSDFMGFFF